MLTPELVYHASVMVAVGLLLALFVIWLRRDLGQSMAVMLTGSSSNALLTRPGIGPGRGLSRVLEVRFAGWRRGTRPGRSKTETGPRLRC